MEKCAIRVHSSQTFHCLVEIYWFVVTSLRISWDSPVVKAYSHLEEGTLPCHYSKQKAFHQR